MAQEHKQPHRSSGSESDEEVAATAAEEDVTLNERKEQLDEDIDAILDEIDNVLESNAEDFVKSFVQKGGQ